MPPMRLKMIITIKHFPGGANYTGNMCYSEIKPVEFAAQLMIL